MCFTVTVVGCKSVTIVKWFGQWRYSNYARFWIQLNYFELQFVNMVVLEVC